MSELELLLGYQTRIFREHFTRVFAPRITIYSKYKYDQTRDTVSFDLMDGLNSQIESVASAARQLPETLSRDKISVCLYSMYVFGEGSDYIMIFAKDKDGNYGQASTELKAGTFSDTIYSLGWDEINKDFYKVLDILYDNLL